MTDLPTPTTAPPAPGQLTFTAPRRGRPPRHLAAVEQLKQRGVRAAGAGGDLVAEALAQGLLRGQIFAQQMHQHGALQSLIGGVVHRGQPPLAELLAHAVAPKQQRRRLRLWGGLGHRVLSAEC